MTWARGGIRRGLTASPRLSCRLRSTLVHINLATVTPATHPLFFNDGLFLPTRGGFKMIAGMGRRNRHLDFLACNTCMCAFPVHPLGDTPPEPTQCFTASCVSARGDVRRARKPETKERGSSWQYPHGQLLLDNGEAMIDYEGTLNAKPSRGRRLAAKKARAGSDKMLSSREAKAQAAIFAEGGGAWRRAMDDAEAAVKRRRQTSCARLEELILDAEDAPVRTGDKRARLGAEEKMRARDELERVPARDVSLASRRLIPSQILRSFASPASPASPAGR